MNREEAIDMRAAAAALARDLMAARSPFPQDIQYQVTLSPADLQAPPLLMPGQILGSYRLGALLGKGGMGEVFAARHLYIERDAAIKVLHPELSMNPRFATSFLNEARAINLVRHPHIVEIYEFTVRPDGTAYIVMELMEGQTLARFVARTPAIPLGQALSVAAQLADALQTAHAAGVVHRDLKPENVMLRSDSAPLHVKILDFGLARIAQTHRTAIAAPRSGDVMGTPAYMAPEQWLGDADISDRADVYSLGVMLYELLTHRLPFDSTHIYDLMALHLHAQPPPLGGLLPELPRELTELCHAMLAKSPDARPSMGAVLTALERVAARRVSLSHEPLTASGAHSEAPEPPPRPTLPERPLLRLSEGSAEQVTLREAQSARILLVGAEPDFTELLGVALRSEGFACRAEPPPQDLLALVREHHPDLVLLDVELGEKSGFRWCWELKAASPDTQVVLIDNRGADAALAAGDRGAGSLTGDRAPAETARESGAAAADQQMALAMGADALLTRPLHLAELVSVVRLVLDRPD